MKLLSKRQLNVEVASQRKAQIDEGIILARKVDKLRETLSDLECQQRNFISGMEVELKNKTEHLINKIGELEKDYDELKEKRKKLYKIFIEEWGETTLKSTQIDSVKSVLDNLDKSLAEQVQKEKKLDALGLEIKDRLSKIKIRERELEKVYLKSQSTEEEIENIKKELLSEKSLQLKVFDEENKKLDILKAQINSQIFTLKNRQEQMEIREKKIEEKEIRLLDQRQTLERAMARLTK